MKYLIFVFLLFIHTFTYANCEPDIHGTFTSTLADPPYTICANHPDFGANKCVMQIYNMSKSGSTWSLFGKTDGATCNEITKLDPDPAQYKCRDKSCPANDDTICPSGYRKGMYNGVLSCVQDKDKPDVLQCTSEYCLNPNNLRCPSGYTSGSMNGLAICAKSSTEEPEPENTECLNDDDADCKVVAAVNNAKDKITESIDNQSNTIGSSIENFWNNIKNYLDEKFGEGTGEGTGEGNGEGTGTGGNGSGSVDVGQLEAELPYIDVPIENKKLSENLFSFNAQCPANNELRLNFLGNSYSYTFEYTKVCDGARILGYFILIAAYMYAATIIIRV